MGLIGKRTKIGKPPFEKILEGFSYINKMDGYENTVSKIEKWVNKNNIKSSNLEGPFLIIKDENCDFAAYANKQISLYKTKDDYDVDNLLDDELYGYCIWTKMVNRNETNDKYIVWVADDGAFIILGLFSDNSKVNIKVNDIFFVDKSKIDISKYKK